MTLCAILILTTMIVKTLTVSNLGNTSYQTLRLDPEATAFETPNGDLIRALGIVLKNELFSDGIDDNMLLENTRVSAELETSETTYNVIASWDIHSNSFIYNVYDLKAKKQVRPSYLYGCISQCGEERNLTRYIYDGGNAYTERFQRYSDHNYYYPQEEFRMITAGAGTTRCFQKQLGEYLRQKLAVDLCRYCGKANVQPNGQIRMRPQKGQKAGRRFKEKTDCILFLELNGFWDSFDFIRDIHHEKWPLVLWFSYINKQDEDDILNLAKRIGRQVIICRQ